MPTGPCHRRRPRAARVATAKLAIAAALSLGATCQPRIEAPAPFAPTVVEPELPPSRIDTFLRIPLDALEARANESVPSTFRVAPFELVVDGTSSAPVVTAGYQMERERIALTVENSRLVLRTTLGYWVRAQRHVGPVEIPGSCGIDGEPPRHFALAITLDARVDPAWNLDPGLGVRELRATDRCEMTFAGVDVTGRVRASLADELGRTLPNLRSRIRDSAGLRDRAAEVWNQLSQPAELGDNTWLELRPETLGLTQPVVEGHFLRVGLALTARPRVVAGSAPPVVVAPMPNATASVGEPSLELHVPVRIDYAILERALVEALRLDTGGVRYPATGRRYVRPTHATLSGYGASVVLRVEFTGFADGVVYLTGTPVLDPETEQLTIPDLEFTLETRSLLMRMAAFLRADDMRSDLRSRLRIDLRTPLEAVRLQLTRALRRRVGPVELTGSVDSLHVAALYADPATQSVRATVRAVGVVAAHYIGE